MRIGLMVALSAVLGLSSPAGAQDAAQSRGPASTEPAMTRQDCDVWVALGRAKFGWGAAPADKMQFKVFWRPAAHGYIEQCPWSAYSITPPPIDSYDEHGSSTGFTGPTYKDGAASVDIINVIPWGQAWGINSETCTLAQANGRWTPLACKPGPMT
jgi:hypothetical protein